MPKHVVVIYVINIIYIYIYIHQIVVLDSRYTPILDYKDTTGMTNLMHIQNFSRLRIVEKKNILSFQLTLLNVYIHV